MKLREVTPSDIDLLFAWANDTTVRQNAFHTEPITYEEHRAWFVRMLADTEVLQYILYYEKKNKNLGQIRFSIEDEIALIDYSIDPNQRGKGLGTRMILMGEEVLRSTRTDVIYCKAKVKPENTASTKVFEKCGYDKKENDTSHRGQESIDYIEFCKRIRS